MRIRLGRSSIDEIESTMTPEQVQLHLHWWMRAQKRTMKLDENAIRQAIAGAFSGG